NCWKFSPSSAASVSVGEPVSGEPLGLEGASSVDWASLGTIFVGDIVMAIIKATSTVMLVYVNE
ncbi:MAG: hypothetical protein QN716_11715, partial [Nitrososphaeraceae archaeon]|nr:hypothetical protein [Nitrososphaeraceae archaeon]